MVPKADSGAFLLLFLLVLTVTEPLRPGARRWGWGRGRGWGWRRPSTRGGWTATAPRPGTGEARLPASGRPLPGHKLKCIWVRSLEDVPFGPTSTERRVLPRSHWPGAASRAHPSAGQGGSLEAERGLWRHLVSQVSAKLWPGASVFQPWTAMAGGLLPLSETLHHRSLARSKEVQHRV